METNIKYADNHANPNKNGNGHKNYKSQIINNISQNNYK